MSTPGDRQTLNEVLVTELGCLRPQLLRNTPAATYQCTDAQRAEDLKGIYQSIDRSRLELSALCLSGGGIRSATFNLGVIQTLARIGLLGKFDYLSSVSGGGYIASWLRAWMHRRGVDEVVRELGKGAKGCDPLNIEPRPVVNLREYSNYLTPAVGLFSGDTWAAAATIVRNLLLNWLVLLPLLSAVIGIPLLFLLAMRTTGIANLSQICLVLALLTELIASLLVFGSRRLAKNPQIPQGYFIWSCVLPICLAGAFLSTAGVGLDPRVTDDNAPWQFAAIWSIGVPVLGWGIIELLTRSSRRAQQKTTGKEDAGVQTQAQIKMESRQVAPLVELAALALSGLVGMSLLAKTTQWWFSYLYSHPALYAILVLPLLLGEYLLSRVLFIGLLSLNDEKYDKAPGEPGGIRGRISSNDSDREWWSRLSGWVLLVIVCWVAVTGVCLIGCYLPSVLFRLFKQDYATVSYIVKLTVTLLGAITGAISALTSSSARTPAPGAAATQPTPGPLNTLMALTGPVFVICMIMVLSWALRRSARPSSRIPPEPLCCISTSPSPHSPCHGRSHSDLWESWPGSGCWVCSPAGS